MLMFRFIFVCCASTVTCSHLVVDGGPELKDDEAVSHHRQSTEEGRQEDGEPHVGLSQRVSRRAWSLSKSVRITE